MPFFNFQANDFNPERVRFAYVLKDIQSEFVGALTQPEQEKQDLNVAIFWRQEEKKLKYEWFGQVWTPVEDNKTQEELKATLKRLLSPNEILSHDTVLKVDVVTAVYVIFINHLLLHCDFTNF